MRLGIQNVYKRTAIALARYKRHQNYLLHSTSIRSMASGDHEQPLTSSTAERQQYEFGPYPISSNEVFARTELSYAFVNLKPIVPGHVLVSPLRVVHRFSDLTSSEVSDLWLLTQLVGKTLEPHYKAESVTLAIQDGPAAGQTVPHVHVHVLPRRPGDFKKNDEVYDEIDRAEAHYTKLSDKKLDLDKDRVVRTRDEMAEEAAQLRKLFKQPLAL